MPRCCSSHAVSRAPCSSGRVSSAKTCGRLPRRASSKIDGQRGAVAAPVASAPALQWVRMPAPSAGRRAGRRRGGPMAAHMLAVFGVDGAGFGEQAFASARGRGRLGSRSLAAHAVERPEQIDRRRAAAWRDSRRLHQRCGRCCTPTHTPYAAATPIAGAPRTLSCLNRLPHVLDRAAVEIRPSRPAAASDRAARDGRRLSPCQRRVVRERLSHCDIGTAAL